MLSKKKSGVDWKVTGHGPSRTVNPPCVWLHRAKQEMGWEKRPAEFKPYYETLLPENLGKHCREWPAGKANAGLHTLVEANSKPHDIVTYTNGSVTRDPSDWGFIVQQSGRTEHEDSDP